MTDDTAPDASSFDPPFNRAAERERFRAILYDLVTGPGLDIERRVNARRGDEPAEEFQDRAEYAAQIVLGYVAYALGFDGRGEGQRPQTWPATYRETRS